MSQAPAPRHLVMLVDDEQSNLDLMGRALRPVCDVVTYRSGAEARAALASGAPCSLIVSDQRMPGLEGTELLGEARRLRPQAKRILITAYTDSNAMLAAINRGEVHRYIVKPWHNEELVFEVRNALAQYDLERERDHLLEELARTTLSLRELNESLEAKVRERTREHEGIIAELRAKEEQLALAIRGAHDGLWDWDLERQVFRTFGRWKAMLGHEDHEIGTDVDEWFERVHPSDLEDLKTAIQQHLEGATEHLEREYRILHKDGSYRWVSCRGLVLRGDDGKPIRMAGSHSDITDHGFQDRGTGLPIRTVLIDRIGALLLRLTRRPELRFAVLVIDIDRFRLINEGLGRGAGDRVLQACTQRLRDTLRIVDTVAYLGRDEFAVLLDEIADVKDSSLVAERLRRALAAPLELEGKTVGLEASIGIAVSTTGYERAADMLEDAVGAMRQAQARGGAASVVFDKELGDRAAKRMQLELDLRAAIEAGALHAEFQPIVRLADRQVVGFEVLARWRDAQRGLVPPMTFIPIAEEAGLVAAIDEQMLAAGCRMCREAERQCGVPLYVSVNMSALYLHHERIVAGVESRLRDNGLEPGRVALEITETALVRDVALSQDVLGRLKQLGVRLSLDDFGTGYSSLVYLNRFPVDTLKIDRTFVSELGEDEYTTNIVRAILALASSLGIAVTAEGIETEAQAEHLRRMGCVFGQGYLFARPLPREQLLQLLERRPAPVAG